MADDADNTDDDPTQWTASARSTYERAAAELIESVRHHAAGTLERQGRQAEFNSYFDSVDALRSAVSRFADAEFDWCGSFPLPPGIGSEIDDDEEDDDEDDGFVPDGRTEQGAVVAVIGRWDFRILDADALVESGRTAYGRAWPDDDAGDAAVAVADATSAVRELLHLAAVEDLEDEPALDPVRGAVVVVARSTDEEGAFADDVDAWIREPISRFSNDDEL